MAPYIQMAIGRIKAFDMATLRDIRRRGKKNVKFTLEPLDIKGKKPAQAVVPIN